MILLYADDNPGDRQLVEEAMKEAGLSCHLRFAEDGQDLMDYLRHRGKHDHRDTPCPDLILLDLNMPRKNGLEALAEIKTDPELRHVPVVVLTSSRAEADVFNAYDVGAASYMVKPTTFEEFVEMIRVFGEWWLDTAQLPPSFAFDWGHGPSRPGLERADKLHDLLVAAD